MTVAKLATVLSVAACTVLPGCPAEAPSTGRITPRPATPASARTIGEGQLVGWWPAVPATILPSLLPTASGSSSNIHPADYVGAQRCQKCHPKNHAGWTRHSHRLMNAVASEETILGDFSGKASLHHQGGRATFFHDDHGEAGRWWMRLQRGDITRTYRVTQTIGSRFYQYYVGRLADGPEPAGHHFYTTDHVLPFGYWLDHLEWVPVVHVHREVPELDREDPFAAAGELRRFAPYAQGCNGCHTTFALGDSLTRELLRLGQFAPWRLHWDLGRYLESHRREFWDESRTAADYSEDDLQSLGARLGRMDAREFAVSLGVSCEACHLGGRQHAENPRVMPAFAPRSQHLAVDARDEKIDPGRSRANLNWACGRCHAGSRSEFAAGMATWNSIEYTDATRGSCYSKLKCVDCHNPHQPIGARWTRTAAQDEAVCLKCHGQFDDPVARRQHTHHVAGSPGNGCLDCHMPRLNEGLQDVVRTHMIFSPNQPDMLEANHPNACNICHVEKSVEWTLQHLDSWYGTVEVRDSELDRSYADRNKAVGAGWIKSDSEAVRLVAVDALIRQRAGWSLPLLVEALDDEFLLNRQFAGKELEELLGIALSELGYRFHMTRPERQPVLKRLRQILLGGDHE
ncbi:MAG: hypothetical protein CMJ65_06800 [Planctomycetaceae bacterium]|jgi:predicted CXXCH cytochrome family protein|nr:hypothetical protein [Planctomycetaceae bacterium]